ncbi:uncharacterized protein LOC142363811 [Opisthocomus hoazin]|uniref:uncharacterized protein LOC142363811 n=1 Tax=Opisthocomus hoazin TaxID=30419 RepID=UPI003F53DD00
MDSPHLMWLCFLLLTIAAPHPNIAMPRDHSAEGTRVSSSRKTTVTVYRCEDCETNTCEPLSNKPFVKIGETQSETFSNEIIQLVTNETHIIMCFQQENTFPEGTYVIFWEKDSGAGDACGIPNSGASAENVRGNIIRICCAAETNLSVPNHNLKCETEMSDETTRKSTADITDEGYLGNPQFSISEKNSGEIIIPVLVVGVCATALAMLFVCVRQKRNGQGPVIVLHQFFDAVRRNRGVPDSGTVTTY